VASNLQIDETLLEQAKNLAGLATKRETVNEALREFIQARLQDQLLELRGKVEFHDDYDYKSLRHSLR
jgi:Arc/MetJ family transcription regulator